MNRQQIDEKGIAFSRMLESRPGDALGSLEETEETVDIVETVQLYGLKSITDSLTRL